MRREDLYIMKLAKAAIFNYTPERINEKLNWNYIYEKSVEQNISGLLYCAISSANLDIDKDLLFRWHNDLVGTVMLMNYKYNEFLRIYRKLKKNGIEPLGFKGCVIRNLYPIPELRTMGDFDILVERDEIAEVAKIFKSEEYDVVNDGFGIVCKNGRVYWEIFKTVEDEFRVNTEKWNQNFRKKVMYENNIKCPIPTYFLIHLIIHMSKHCVRAGAGIRNLCDIALYISKYKEKIDFDLVEKACLEQGFRTIYYYTMDTMNKWFDIDTSGINYEEKDCDKFIEYALLNGIFGKQGNTLVAQITKHEDDNIYGLRKIFFPGIKILEHKYTYLKKFPVLLPIAWIHRLINGIVKWKYSIGQMSGDVKGAMEYSKERLKWLEELGLTDELKNK